jgi:hypothetical protein
VRAFFSLHQSDVIPDALCATLSDGHICRSAIEIATYMNSGAAMRVPRVVGGTITRVRRTNAKSEASVSVRQPT